MTELSPDGNNRRRNSVHRCVAQLAKRQHGPFRRDQLPPLGMSLTQAEYAVKCGRFEVVHPSVYKFAGVDLSRLGEASAAVLAAEPDAFVAFRTAARFRGADDRYEGPIEIAVKRHPPPDLKGVEVHEARLLPYETGSFRGVPCITLPRLMLQLATVQDMKQLTRAYEKAKRQGLTLSQLERVIDNHKGERGIANLRKLVERHNGDRGGSRGSFEDAFYAWLKKILPRGFPLPERNALVELSDGSFKERDLVWRQAHIRAIIELNFFDHHGRAQATLDTQVARDLRSLGWKVEMFTSDEFDDERDRVRRDVFRVLGISAVGGTKPRGTSGTRSGSRVSISTHAPRVTTDRSPASPASRRSRCVCQPLASLRSNGPTTSCSKVRTVPPSGVGSSFHEKSTMSPVSDHSSV
jgi:hypothetical protein